ncbi:Tetratricopeptide repeat protein 16-like [Oopsacas minuta]|uniref:Tetratricopeptide repeat protein 16-like n=1 Tax=Oopsacas minuta TaxID=111878 RepID=A0AAV7KJP1_9METZ|nr:Tetratricopeptide repeat protein 16-like [Oopsacas minuta]
MEKDNASFFITEENTPKIQSYQELISQKLNTLSEDADSLIENSEYENALIILNKLVVLDSESYIHYVRRAHCLFHICDFKSAIINMEKALVMQYSDELNEKCGFYHFLYAQTLYDQKLYIEAVKEFDKAIQINSKTLIYHVRKLACIWSMSEHNKCLDLINQLLIQYNCDSNLLVLRAVLYYSYGKHTKCFEDVHQTLNIDSNNAIALSLNDKLASAAAHHKEQALSLHMQNKNREALKKINLAIETNPACADFNIFRGVVYRNLHDYSSAADDFLIALNKCNHDQDNPTYWDSNKQLILTYNDFAVHCYKKKFYEEALQLLNKGIESEKNEKGLYMNRGDCYLQLGHYDFARSDYEQALQIDETSSLAKSRLAFVYYSKGNDSFSQSKYSTATEQFSQAIEFAPAITHFYFCRAKSRLVEGKIEESKIDALISLLLSPGIEFDPALRSRLFPDARTPEHLLQSPEGKIAIEYMRRINCDTRSLELANTIPKEIQSQSHSVENTSQLEDNEIIDEENTMQAVSKFCSQDLIVAPRAWNVISDNLPAIPAASDSNGIMPDLKKCMDEIEFHKQIYYTRKRIDGEVEEYFKNN